MPKAKIQEEVVVAEEPQEPEEIEDEVVEEEVEEPPPEPAPPKPKSRAKITKVPVPEVPEPEPVKKRAPKKPAQKKDPLDLKQKHTCGRCGKTMSLHTALYSHKCPEEVTVPQPPALLRHPVREEPPPEPPVNYAQQLRMQLAQAAQERRAQAHLRMVNPIRQFYGLSVA